MQKGVIEQVRQEAKKYFQGACPSHDWTHIERVYNLAVQIGEREGADIEILKLSVLLHDIGRKEEEKYPDGLCHAQISAEFASEILQQYQIPKQTIQQILHCISTHRFRKNQQPETSEAKILFDADKLDSIGAIGVARAYAWTGKQGISLYSDKDYLGTGYEPEHSPMTEFRYKLSKVKGRLFTQTAKQIAQQRHDFMTEFFNRLNKEVEGKA